MTIKTRKRLVVGFYATSSRIAHAYRSSAKHNKCLSRLAAIVELGHATGHDAPRTPTAPRGSCSPTRTTITSC